MNCRCGRRSAQRSATYWPWMQVPRPGACVPICPQRTFGCSQLFRGRRFFTSFPTITLSGTTAHSLPQPQRVGFATKGKDARPKTQDSKPDRVMPNTNYKTGRLILSHMSCIEYVNNRKQGTLDKDVPPALVTVDHPGLQSGSLTEIASSSCRS